MFWDGPDVRNTYVFSGPLCNYSAGEVGWKVGADGVV